MWTFELTSEIIEGNGRSEMESVFLVQRSPGGEGAGGNRSGTLNIEGRIIMQLPKASDS